MREEEVGGGELSGSGDPGEARGEVGAAVAVQVRFQLAEAGVEAGLRVAASGEGGPAQIGEAAALQPRGEDEAVPLAGRRLQEALWKPPISSRAATVSAARVSPVSSPSKPKASAPLPP